MHLQLWPLQLPAGMPFLVVGPALAVWARARSPVPGWTAVTLLLAAGLTEPLAAAHDLARWGEGCAGVWEPMLPWRLTEDLFVLVPAGLVYAAVRRRRGPGRRGRVVGAFTMVAVLLLATGGDQGRRRIVAIDPEECRFTRVPTVQPDEVARIEAIARMPVATRERAYLCMLRGYDAPFYGPSSSSRYEDVADGEFLWRGRRACEQLRAQGRLTKGGTEDWRRLGGLARRPWRLDDALTFLCPDAMLPRARAAAETRRRLEQQYRKQRARDEASCRRSARRDPKAVRQKTALVTTGEGGGYSISDEGGGAGPFHKAIDDGLIAADGTAAVVMTGVENDDICITVRAYRTTPPLDLERWDRVAEVGIDSPHGAVRVFMPMAEPPKLPILTAAGPGTYRIRVHVRDRDAAELPDGPLETHLVEVFPGTSTRLVAHKDTE
ncbi:MAG: hypothetical protein IRY90_06195 [Actinomadura rubrobrunea]|nr:hypothetical protein [Actinomadura rubrobrunea]